MNIQRVNSENILEELLVTDILESGRNKLLILGGHFPLEYKTEGVVESINKWGEFSTYSLDFGAKIGNIVKKEGINVNFVFFVDDHCYEPNSGLSGSQMTTRRNQLYKLRSGKDAKLNEVYSQILSNSGFYEDNILRQNQGKNGREDCLYFSEKKLRSSARGISNACAREYTEFVENPSYFDKKLTHMLAFVPQRCQDHICDVALDEEIEDISSNHVFMSTSPMLRKEEIFIPSGNNPGVIYRKD
jgi:hypothetical protein